MTNESFTPSEWRVEEGGKFVDGCAITSDSRDGMVEICEVKYAYLDGGELNDFEREQVANAHLIAAAPDMYRALCDMVDQFNAEECVDFENEADYRVIKAARAALAKAEGGA